MPTDGAGNDLLPRNGAANQGFGRAFEDPLDVAAGIDAIDGGSGTGAGLTGEDLVGVA